MGIWHSQTAYAGLKKFLHKKWAFVQRVTLHIGKAFRPLEEALEKSFVLALFKGATVEVSTRGITCPTIKKAGLTILNPNFSTWENWTASCVVTGHLIAYICRQTEFKTRDQYMLLL